MKPVMSIGSESEVIKETACPTCAYVMERATGLNGARAPQHGDLSLCAKCGEILVFNSDNQLQLPTVSDLMNLPSDVSELLDRAQRVIRKERLIQ